MLTSGLLDLQGPRRGPPTAPLLSCCFSFPHLCRFCSHSSLLIHNYDFIFVLCFFFPHLCLIPEGKCNYLILLCGFAAT